MKIFIPKNNQKYRLLQDANIEVPTSYWKNVAGNYYGKCKSKILPSYIDFINNNPTTITTILLYANTEFRIWISKNYGNTHDPYFKIRLTRNNNQDVSLNILNWKKNTVEIYINESELDKLDIDPC